MATTKQIAEQLRKLAEHIESLPEAEAGDLLLMNLCTYDKEVFKVQASMMPRPIKKETRKWTQSEDLILTHETGNGVQVHFSIDRSRICKLLKPAQAAVYECEPIFSAEEEDSL